MWAGLQNAGAAKTAQIWGRGRKAQSSHENRTIKLVTHTHAHARIVAELPDSGSSEADSGLSRGHDD